MEALQKNKSIVQLEMAGNNIPSDTLRALGKVCVCVYYNVDMNECTLVSVSDTSLFTLLNPLRSDHRAQLGQTIQPEREPQQESGPHQGDSYPAGGEGPAGKPHIKE